MPECTQEISPGRLRLASVSGFLFYFLYPGIEIVIGLWGASWMIERFSATPALAGISITLYWAALTAGRFGVGLFSEKIANHTLIRGGILLAFAGGIVMALAPGVFVCQLALVLTGFGIAPLYPTMMHDTPRRVGFAHSDRLTGFQVGAALFGTTLIPPLVGVVAQQYTLAVFTPALLLFCLLVLFSHELSFRYSLLANKTAA